MPQKFFALSDHQADFVSDLMPGSATFAYGDLIGSGD